MDTKRALIVIMILLIFINITLAAYIFFINKGTYDYDQIEQYTIGILNQRNIELNCRIPAYKIKSGRIIYGDSIFKEQNIDAIESMTNGKIVFDDTLGILEHKKTSAENEKSGEMNRADAESAAKEFIKMLALDKNDFVLDSVVVSPKNTYTLIYIYKGKDGIHYYDIYIKMDVNSLGVVNAELKNNLFVNDTAAEQESLPISTILLVNITWESNKSLIIKSINAGYRKLSVDSNNAVMCWRIGFDDGSERFFEADSGKEIF